MIALKRVPGIIPCYVWHLREVMDLGVKFYTISTVCVKCLRNRCQESKTANLIFGMLCINRPLPLIKSEADYK